MKAAAVLVGCGVCGVPLLSFSVAAAAGRPSISIISPAPDAVVHGTQLTVHVQIANFRLVQPVLVNPPILKGNAGHIHYVIDGHKTFARSAATSYTWTHLSPGRHTITAYLATSQYAAFPGARPASVTVTISPAPTVRPVRKPAHGPGIGHAPTTGGAADVAGSPLNLSLLLAGIVSIILGLLFLTTRFGAIFGGRRDQESPSGNDKPLKGTPTPAVAVHEESPGAVAEPESGLQLHAPPSPPPTSLPLSEAYGQTSEDRARDEEIASASADRGEEFGSDEPVTVEASTLPEDTLKSLPAPSHTGSIQAAELSDSPTTTRAEATASDDGQMRSQAVAMAQQWAEVIDGLVKQLNQQDEERRQLLSRIQVMEQALEADRALREQLQHSSSDEIAAEELQKLRYVTTSLIEDPDHIVVLAAVAQHAGPLKRIVEDYARIRHMLEDR